MFDVGKIQSGLFGLVGVRPALDPTLPTVDTTNQESRSGLYVDDIEPFEIGLFVASQAFAQADATQFNTALAQMQKSAITNVMYKVFDGQITMYDKQVLFTKAAPTENIETTIPDGSVIGYRLTPSDEKNVAFKIRRVLCQFDFDGSDIECNLFLMNSNWPTPLKTQNVTLTSQNQWVQLDWVLNNTDNEYKGEYYLLVAPVNGLRLTPFKRDLDDANKQNVVAELECERVSFGTTSQTFSIVNFNSDNALELSENVGLNPDLVVYEDYTEFILNNEQMFSRVIQLEFAISLMNKIATSRRSNRDERLGREIVAMMLTHINGVNADGEIKVRGLKDTLYYQVKGIKKEVEKLKQDFFGNELQTITLE